MNSDMRRELARALIELLGVDASAEERAKLAQYWADAADAGGIDEDRLAGMVISGLRGATSALARARSLYGVDGPMAELFAKQSAQLAEAGRVAGLSKGRASQVEEKLRKQAIIAELAQKGLSQRNVAMKTGISRKTVGEYWPRAKK